MSEAALYSPPVYRRFLAGGADNLRLSLPAAGLVAVCGTTLLAVRLVASSPATASDWLLGSASVAATVFVAVLIAALSARWLGSRLGMLAGLVYQTSLHVLRSQDGPSLVGTLFCASVTLALGAFALANVPGRLPLRQDRWIGWAFYAAAGLSFVVAGPVGPAFVLAACLPFLGISQDTRGFRFFANFTGIAAFLLVAIAGLSGLSFWDGNWTCLLDRFGGRSLAGQSFWGLLGDIPTGIMPWTPFAILAIIGGLRQGHTATPIWLLFACWTLGPLALVAIETARDPLLLGALLPPLAVIGAAGLSDTLHWAGRWRRW